MRSSFFLTFLPNGKSFFLKYSCKRALAVESSCFWGNIVNVEVDRESQRQHSSVRSMPGSARERRRRRFKPSAGTGEIIFILLSFDITPDCLGSQPSFLPCTSEKWSVHVVAVSIICNLFYVVGFVI